MTLFAIVRGRYDERSAGRSACYPAGTFAYHPPEEAHDGQFGSGVASGFHVELTRELIASRGIALGRRHVDAREQALVATLLHHLRAEFRRPDVGQLLALEGLVLQLMATLARADRHGLSTAREACAVRQVQDALADGGGQTPDWETMARAVDVPALELSRAFRRALGCTPAAYVRRARLDRAAHTVVGGAAPIGRIALDAGYYDQAHFCRAFKAWFGVTPSAYRAAARG